MGVERAFTFAEYFSDETLRSRLDNIYRPKAAGGYVQQRNAFHGPDSIRKDLSADRVLLSKRFIYFGEKAPFIPEDFREFVPRGRGHRVFGNALGEQDDPNLSKKVRRFVRWAFSGGEGPKGRPFDQPRKHHNCFT
jgi:Nucleotide modification associated domain 2